MTPTKRRSDGKLSGTEKVAVLLMSVEDDVASKVFTMLSEEEIKSISHAMSELGAVEPKSKEEVLAEFSNELSSGTGIIGDQASTTKLLTKALGKEKVANLMDDISGPAGRDTWEKLNNVNEDILASYLKNEYPQTAALVLSKLRSAQSARVLSVLPDDFALDVIQRIITMEPVKREVLNDIESTLQAEFMSNLAATKQFDSYEMVAEVFNNFDRNTEGKFLDLLDQNDPDSAEKIRDLMFTFDDLIKIDNAGIQALLRKADKENLATSLKGASDEIRELFFRNMSERAAKIMQEDMEAKGPVRMKEVDQAQTEVVNTAKELADTGELVIPEGGDEEDEMVY